MLGKQGQTRFPSPFLLSVPPAISFPYMEVTRPPPDPRQTGSDTFVHKSAIFRRFFANFTMKESFNCLAVFCFLNILAMRENAENFRKSYQAVSEIF